MKKIVNVFPFEELEEDAQEKLLEKYRYACVDGWDWYQFLLEAQTERLAALGYQDAKINFSGFCSQGDGASFTCRVDVLKWIRANKRTQEFRPLVRALESGTMEIVLDIVRTSYHYSHEMTVNVASPDVYDYTDTRKPMAEEMAQSLPDAVIAMAREEMRKIYRELEDDYNGLTSDESVKDFLAGNEMLFFADGTRFHG